MTRIFFFFFSFLKKEREKWIKRWRKSSIFTVGDPHGDEAAVTDGEQNRRNRTGRSQFATHNTKGMAVIPRNLLSFSNHTTFPSKFELHVPNQLWRFMQDSSGTTLMDLITADPTPAPTSSSASSSAASTAAAPPASLPSALGKPPTEKKSKRATLMQIQNDTISAAKAALHPVRTNIMPQKQKKKVPQFLFSSLIILWLKFDN